MLPAFAPALVLAAVVVEGTSACPTAEQVAARLAALAPAADPGGRAVITRQENALDIRWLAADGTVRGERRLDAGFACAELAEAAGLVLATWMADLRLAPPAAPPAAPARIRSAVAAEAGGAAISPSAGSERAVELGAGALGVLGPGPPVPGLTVTAGFLPRTHGFGVWLGLRLVTLRRQALGSEGRAAQWARLPLWLGATYAVGLGPDLRLDAHADLAAALLAARGEGFAENVSFRTVDLGAGGGLRLSSSGARWALWLDLCAVGWPRAHQLVTLPSPGPGDAGQALPQLDVALAVGLLHRFGPAAATTPAR
jgi:hypothetical protein